MQLISHLAIAALDWQSLMVPVAGLAVTLIIMGAGFFWVGRRKPKVEALCHTTPVRSLHRGNRTVAKAPGAGRQSNLSFVTDPKTTFEGYVMDRSMGGLRSCSNGAQAESDAQRAGTDAPQTVTQVQVRFVDSSSF